MTLSTAEHNLSHENRNDRFVATGPNEGSTIRGVTGFHTDAAQLVYGVNVSGNTCGAWGESQSGPPIENAQDGSRSGVWGVGDDYGVYGASKDLYTGSPVSDVTPRLNPELRPVYLPTLLGPTPGSGCIGVVGASVALPGVIGTSDVSEDFAYPPTQPSLSKTQYLDGPDSLISHPVGVMGLSVNSAGVIGANVTPPSPVPPAINPDSHVPPQITFLLETPPQSNVGVFGWSHTGRGGVFASAAPAVQPETPASTSDQGAAQVRLVPNFVTFQKQATSAPKQQPLPSLPLEGLAGDLIAVEVLKREGGSATQLWFCINAGVDGAPATWAQIAFGVTVPGTF